jgi:hypothetical protein
MMIKSVNFGDFFKEALLSYFIFLFENGGWRNGGEPRKSQSDFNPRPPESELIG